MESVFGGYPKLHHYYKKMAKAVLNNANLIVKSYDGDASKIWKTETDPRVIQLKLRDFSWISQKKSSMATNILIRDFNLPVNSKKGIDVSFDRHVRRVFLRTGLVNIDSQYEIIMKARELSPEYPGELDYPAWRIGRYFCFPKKPNCGSCFLNVICPKLTLGHK